MIFKRWHHPAHDPGDWDFEDMPPLHWRPVVDAVREGLDRLNPKQVVAIITCKVGHACCLRVGEDSRFTVSVVGVVQPSIVCPVEGCTGHEDPGSTLEGYAPN